MNEFSILDLLVAPIYIVVFLALARRKMQAKIEENPIYEFYIRGLTIKMIGGIGLCFVYLFYYGGGDTLNYMHDARIMLRMAGTDFGAFCKIMVNGLQKADYVHFNRDIGYPEYNYNKKEEWVVIRYTVPFAFLGLRLYIPTTLVLAWFSYQGIWRMYMVFADTFKRHYKELAIPLLFIPSCAFWGTGVLKDTFTFSAIGWYLYSFYNIFIKRDNPRKHVFALIMASWIIITIKAYIFIALMPGSLIWLNFERLQAIKSPFLRFMALPVLMGGVGLGGILLLTQLGGAFGKYSSVDKVLETAVVTQQDLKRAEYQGASFDIGNFDPSIGGVTSKFPAATTAGLFRPFIWEARNPVMLISGLENLLFLGFTIRLLFSFGLMGFFTTIGKNPLLLFSLIFSVFFAFSIGLTTSNFGSLVRYKIPCEPFYLATMFVLFYEYRKIKNADGEIITEEAVNEYPTTLKEKEEKGTGFITR